MREGRVNIFSPQVFLPLFVSAFYFAGLALVEFSPRALFIIATGLLSYLAAVYLAQRIPGDRGALDGEQAFAYFERLLLSLLAVFILDLVLKQVAPLALRAPLYLGLMTALFYVLGKSKFKLNGTHYLGLGLLMISAYVIPAFAMFGLYGSYLNRTGGLMPAFLVGIGTIVTVYGLMKIAGALDTRRLLLMATLIAAIIGPLMAAGVGYRAYAIIYIMPLVFQYYLERNRPVDFKAGAKAAAVVILIFIYTYLATSVARGVMYNLAPLDSPNAPAFVIESMEKGGYTYSDMALSSSEVGQKFITRPFFTYKVFLEVIEDSYPWGQSHGRLTLSLMPGVNLGRATTISILGKPFSTSFFGLAVLEFGILGVIFYSGLLGICLATAARFRDPKVYALMLTVVMLWLDTGPSVWWHWLPFAAALLAFGSLVLRPRQHS